jgi:stress response protein YsnF
VVDRKNLPDYESLTRRARNTSEPVRGIYRKRVALSAGVHVAATLTRRAMIKQHVLLRRGCVVFLTARVFIQAKTQHRYSCEWALVLPQQVCMINLVF